MGKKKGCVCHWTFAVTHHPANSRILSSTDFPSLSWNPYHLSGLRQCLLSIFHCFPVSDRPFQLRLKEHEGPHCLGKKCLISEHPGAISNLLWTLPVLCCEGAQMFFIAYWNTSTDSWTGIKRDRILKWRTHLTYRKTNQVEKKNPHLRTVFIHILIFWMLCYHIRSLNLQLKTAAIWLTHSSSWTKVSSMSYQNQNRLKNISVSMNSETKSFLLRFFPEKGEENCLAMLSNTCLLLSRSFLELSLLSLGRKKKMWPLDLNPNIFIHLEAWSN